VATGCIVADGATGGYEHTMTLRRDKHGNHTRGRRWTAALATLAAAGVCGLTLAHIAPVAASATLAGSTFEGGDGNLTPDTTSNTDWSNVAGLNTGIDLPSGSADNAFGQGTKEDNPAVTVVNGSIPPNKSDLTRFYEASEFANGSNFLYLAWERSNVLGSANMDFEINQHPTAGFTGSTTGPVTLNRTAGDMLVTYDFTNGGSTPVLGLLRWVTSGPTSQCFSSSSLPCWGNHMSLNSGDSQGAINTVGVVDPLQAGSPTLPAFTFGETAINLTAAGVFPSGTCEAFGSAFVKSRSSTSFSAEVKDFIAPIPVSISNCGTITVHKVTENGDDTFHYTTTGGLTPSTFTMSNGGSQSYTLLPAGSYSISEPTMSLPTGWTLKSLVCGTVTGSGTSATVSGPTVSITMTGGGNVDCTYTNHTKVSPTIATILSASSVSIGTTVHDTATLSGATAGAGGTVTYTVYSDSGCGMNPQDAGTVTVTNGSVPNSNGIQFNSAGTFYWQAAYSGDADNNPATSPCTSEQLVVNPNPTAMTTAPQVIPNDHATLSGATMGAGGTITFGLFSPSDATCASTPAYQQTVNVSGNGTYTTTNSTFTADVPGTWRWKVVYSGDPNNAGSTSACGVEQFTLVGG
jgi:hypothetical protein